MERRVAVIAQAAGVDARRHEVVAEGVHLHQRREAGGVAVAQIAVDLNVGPEGRRHVVAQFDGLLPQAHVGIVEHNRPLGFQGAGDIKEPKNDRLASGRRSAKGWWHWLEGPAPSGHWVDH